MPSQPFFLDSCANYPADAPIACIVLADEGLVGEAICRELACDEASPRFALKAVLRSGRKRAHTRSARVEEARSKSGEEVLIFEDCRELIAHFAHQGGQHEEAKPLVFSALPSEAASSIELLLRQEGFLVITNASAHRMRDEVPLWLPGFCQGGQQEALITQKKRYGGGAIVAQSNCCVAILARALAPLAPLFSSITHLHCVTMQSLSGAGKRGPLALEMVGNVGLHIEGEAEKIEPEIKKIFGSMLDAVAITAQCHRVATKRGHLLNLQLYFQERVFSKAALEERFLRAWREGEGASDTQLVLGGAPLEGARSGAAPLARFEPAAFERLCLEIATKKRLEAMGDRPKGLQQDRSREIVVVREIQAHEQGQQLQCVIVGDNLGVGAAKGVVAAARDLWALGLLDS